MSGATRIAAIAAAAETRTAARLAERIRAEAPDRRVERAGNDVIVSGRGVSRDPRLVWIGSLLR